MAQDLPEGLTVGEIVRSAEWSLVEAVMRAELAAYIRELTNLDPFDERHAPKAIVLSAKIKTLKTLNRRFYREAGLDEVEGEESIAGGKGVV